MIDGGGKAFVIMQIGDQNLDNVYHQAIEPAIRACGLEPRRIDKHNEGGLLKSEIDNLIRDAVVIVGDLTNERPNCYCEIGYAMGLGKFKHLVLTAREDHNTGSPNYRPGGPRVHFDLSGYDILFWDCNKLEDLRAQLEKGVSGETHHTAQVSTVSSRRTLISRSLPDCGSHSPLC